MTRIAHPYGPGPLDGRAALQAGPREPAAGHLRAVRDRQERLLAEAAADRLARAARPLPPTRRLEAVRRHVARSLIAIGLQIGGASASDHHAARSASRDPDRGVA